MTSSSHSNGDADGGYATVKDYISTLEEHDLLRRVSKPIDKNLELMPLVRCQFRGLSMDERTAWLFENPIGFDGEEYDIPVAVGLVGASREVYRLGLNCETDGDVVDTWNEALDNPIEPREISESPIKDVKYEASEVSDPAEMDILPVPISTPGFDPAPFHTANYVVTKDPETGVYNMGTYRSQLKGPLTYGIQFGPGKGAYDHWLKARERGEPLEAAIVNGAPPHISMVSVSRVPAQQDERAVSGGLIDEPVETIECETVDLSVPACGEIIIEGTVTPETYPEGPFGEYTGYIGENSMSPNFEISCITHRENPIYQAFLSQMPPSESSLIKKVGYEENIRRHIRNSTISNVNDVVMHEMSGSRQILVIELEKDTPAEPWQAMYAAMGYFPSGGKFTIAVDPDIDPHDLKSVGWAMSFRTQPDTDMTVLDHRMCNLDPSSAPLDVEERRFPGKTGDSAVLIDATRDWDYPPTSLPAKEFMERARDLWDELEFPELDLVDPWYGQTLGWWPQANADAAEAAVEGNHYEFDYEERMKEVFADRSGRDRIEGDLDDDAKDRSM